MAMPTLLWTNLLVLLFFGCSTILPNFVFAFDGLGLGDIHDEKYFCQMSSADVSNDAGHLTTTTTPSERRILLVSPQKYYLSSRYCITSGISILVLY